MKVIELTKGHVAIVDDEDFAQLAQYRWCVTTNGHGLLYAMRRIGKKPVYMHRVILNASHGIEIDHKNGDTLDNRRSNLRLATRRQNACNKKVTSNSLLQVKGVSYNEAAVNLHGEFAKLN